MRIVKEVGVRIVKQHQFNGIGLDWCTSYPKVSQLLGIMTNDMQLPDRATENQTTEANSGSSSIRGGKLIIMQGEVPDFFDSFEKCGSIY